MPSPLSPRKIVFALFGAFIIFAVYKAIMIQYPTQPRDIVERCPQPTEPQVAAAPSTAPSKVEAAQPKPAQPLVKEKQLQQTTEEDEGDILIAVSGTVKHMDRAQILANTWMRGANTTYYVGSRGIEQSKLDELNRVFLQNKQPYGGVAARAFFPLSNVNPYEYPPLNFKHSVLKHILKYVKEENEKSMQERGKPRFRWILRVDDDVIVCHKRLRALLSKLNPNADIYTGRLTWFGRDTVGYFKVRGQGGYILYSGGFADVFSIPMAEKVVPVLDKCAQWSRTVGIPYDDVVMGNCVKEFAGGEFFSSAIINADNLSDKQYEKLRTERDFFMNVDFHDDIMGNPDPFTAQPALKYAAVIHRVYPNGLYQRTIELENELGTCY